MEWSRDTERCCGSFWLDLVHILEEKENIYEVYESFWGWLYCLLFSPLSDSLYLFFPTGFLLGVGSVAQMIIDRWVVQGVQCIYFSS
jgi:hypothetical protein